MRRLTQEDFVRRATEIHKGKYDYGRSFYETGSSMIEIGCPVHGVFRQKASDHLAGRQCPFCARRYNRLFGKFNKTTEDFIRDARVVHGDLWDYSESVWNGSNKPLKIRCREHGIFEQTPNHHVSGKCGCPVCKKSKGERNIERYLQERNISYLPQKKYGSCRNEHVLPFDFALMLDKEIVLVEYHGRQHYEEVPGFWARNEFEGLAATQKRDRIKRDWAERHGIRLCVIPYWDHDRIPVILDQLLNESEKGILSEADRLGF